MTLPGTQLPSGHVINSAAKLLFRIEYAVPRGVRGIPNPKRESEMSTKREAKLVSRRELLQTTAVIAGSTVFSRFFPAALRARAAALPWPPYPQQGGAPADPVAAMRAQMAAAPMET